MQSDKDKTHIQPYQGAISMNNNIRILPIATYAHPETRPREECGQNRQSRDSILRRREEAVTAERLKIIDIHATANKACGIRKRGKSQTSHRMSPPSSNEGGGREKKRHRLYKRVKGKTEPKNKREGADTCGQSISDVNAWNAPSHSLQKILVRTRAVLHNREKMSPPTKSVDETKTNQKPGSSKKPSCKEEAEKLAIIGSNAWAKKKKKTE
jgi:hypothetical protein